MTSIEIYNYVKSTNARLMRPLTRMAVYWRYYCTKRSCHGHAFVVSAFVRFWVPMGDHLTVNVMDLVRHEGFESSLTRCDAPIRWKPYQSVDQLRFLISDETSYYVEFPDETKHGIRFGGGKDVRYAERIVFTNSYEGTLWKSALTM